MENKTKKMLVLLGVLVILAIIIIAVASEGRKQTVTPSTSPTGNTQPIDEAAEEPIVVDEMLPDEEINEILKDAVVAAPGANPVTTDNKVVNLSGEETQNNAPMTSPLAPAQTGPIAKEDLASTAVKLDASASGFSPSEFKVKAGAPVTVSLTGVDSAHTFVFEDTSLSAIAVGVYKNETRAITFNAPTEKGEYIFYCNVGGTVHKNRGEVGKMIVE